AGQAGGADPAVLTSSPRCEPASGRKQKTSSTEGTENLLCALRALCVESFSFLFQMAREDRRASSPCASGGGAPFAPSSPPGMPGEWSISPNREAALAGRQPPLRIGVDLGGTKIEAVAMRGSEIIARRRIASPRGDYAATLAAIEAIV